ncbi:tetratricopeptide repeat protein [uncultured Neptuniibacter sp.]|uniref:YfgM family protein n=1 Tax=uncultured Neptuniibacter sp. TaxID=502143 RepID=UPI0026303814|nr:tetratricopeptide repeat protein [uncultured Neptuniibacter sp.]
MAELRTEEEQVQALKSWWDENGKSLLLGVAVALAAVLGWKGWQDQQAAKAENASILYQNLLDAVVGGIGPQQDAAKLTTANHLSDQLKADYDDTTYASYAALIMARVAVDQNEIEKAKAELDWVLASQPTESIYVVATLRKARVLAAQENYDDALALINAAPVGGYKASIEEVKGDLYLAKGDKAKAQIAYQAAYDASPANTRPVLEMKLNDLSSEDS